LKYQFLLGHVNLTDVPSGGKFFEFVPFKFIIVEFFGAGSLEQ
jgi:hypothetical protein